ncbi:hypothetical protein JW992_11830 [candidate division KSB1 bacterium]|nr:hypothetical protein [candidate division KSB1 bacterium]
MKLSIVTIRHDRSSGLIARVSVLVFAVCHFCLSSCGRQEPQEPKIVARIGSRVLTVDEFVRRAEYTVRPAYCRGDNTVHKKIVLNSLVAEKLLAWEAEDSSELNPDESLLLHLQARKEQAMRRIYYQNLRSQITLTDPEIRNAYRFAGRTVELEAEAFPPDATDADQADRIDSVEQFDRDNEPLRRRIAWSDPVPQQVHAALFNDSLRVGQTIGPIVQVDGSALMMRVSGWSDEPALSESAVNERLQTVQKHLIDVHTTRLWAKEIWRLMRGKRLRLNPQGFDALVRLLQPLYFERDETDDLLQPADSALSMRQELGLVPDDQNEQPLYEIDGVAVTLGEFQRLLRIHPLVFRNNKFPASRFPYELRTAIADLVRDIALTREAYQRDYDRDPEVVEETEMWRDALLAQRQIRFYLIKHAADGWSEDDIVERILTPYVDALQKKYSDQIQIDVDAFDAIRLTRIDLVALERNAPFPLVVPDFPQVTTDPVLDYGRRLE